MIPRSRSSSMRVCSVSPGVNLPVPIAMLRVRAFQQLPFGLRHVRWPLHVEPAHGIAARLHAPAVQADGYGSVATQRAGCVEHPGHSPRHTLPLTHVSMVASGTIIGAPSALKGF